MKSKPLKLRRVDVSLAFLASVLALPEGVTIRMVRGNDSPYLVSLLLEHDSFEEVPEGEIIPIFSPVFETQDNGRVRLKDWGLGRTT